MEALHGASPFLSRPTAQPLPIRSLDATAGADPLEKLTRALAELKAQAILPLLSAAMQALNSGHADEALKLTGQVLGVDPACGLGLARGRALP